MERAVMAILACSISGTIGGIIGKLKGFDFWESFGLSAALPIVGWFIIIFKSDD